MNKEKMKYVYFVSHISMENTVILECTFHKFVWLKWFLH